MPPAMSSSTENKQGAEALERVTRIVPAFAAISALYVTLLLDQSAGTYFAFIVAGLLFYALGRLLRYVLRVGSLEETRRGSFKSLRVGESVPIVRSCS